MITDGDLRRHMGPELLKARVQDIMTKKPNTLSPGMLASAALERINSLKRTQMFVVDKGKPVGVVHVHDISDPFQPKEVAFFVPETPKGTSAGSVQINDCYVDENEIVYAVDRFTGGLYTLEMTL